MKLLITQKRTIIKILTMHHVILLSSILLPSMVVTMTLIKRGEEKTGDGGSTGMNKTFDRFPLCLLDTNLFFPPAKSDGHKEEVIPNLDLANRSSSGSPKFLTPDPESSDRITGGHNCYPDDPRPYQAGVIIDFGDPHLVYFCGGSLIKQGYVLTAAHCCDPAISIILILGAKQLVPGEGTHVPSVKIIKHPKWNSAKLEYDCCIVAYNATAYPITEGGDVRTVSILQSDLTDKELTASLPPGLPATVSGWGVTSTCPDGGGSSNNDLQCLKVWIIPNYACKSVYTSITDAHICTVAPPGQSTCFGDSGGPLTITEGNKVLQVGIVSFGLTEYCEAGTPDVFARVFACLEWIKMVTGGLP